MQSFQEYFGLDKKSPAQKADINGNIVAILQAGCFFGALGAGYISSRWGRKPSLLASGVIYMIGSLIQSIVGLRRSQAVALPVLYCGRFMGGLGVGMVSALVPSYVSESVPRMIRGRCTGMIQLANNVGIMLSFWVNYTSAKDIPFGEMQWRIPFIMQMIPGVFFILAMIFQPESPRWLVEHGQYEEAAMVLARNSGTDIDDPALVQTMEDIKLEFVGKKPLSILQQIRRMGDSQHVALRCFIPSLVMFFQQWTGTNAVNYFSPQIFESLGIKGTTATLFATGVYGAVKVVSVGAVLAFAIEGIGRKKCLLLGSIGQAVTMLWLGGYSGVYPDNIQGVMSYVSIVAVYLYAVFYSIGWGTISWVVAGEVAPNHLRSATLSFSTGVNWLFAFTVSKLTPILLDRIKNGTFLLFGSCCLVMVIWSYVCFPETSGYALEDMKYLFEQDVIIRSLQDAPGGKMLLWGRRAVPVVLLKDGVDGEDDPDGEANDYDSDLDSRQPLLIRAATSV
ncbi:hypothetical protein AGABI2DRAFT_218760 [Agaricus bisporus var. bisporus H97]|uniref:hypothetical protein n=1 Tax=Agaricus bisporus var. bisporus (strain H97 / ATCC MYA-4626 / FGSC 10389) TaxID=936046 RepID=UPI00029F5A9D|nr:hypothetical protein AGABI2DRAFT_218760 [Agaricus bisporus var. bisporus H97]EKV49415.1 hypothetical protein AGABI2DRAFT_218760 [Agaricus bisporus var. bisporus H97]